MTIVLIQIVLAHIHTVLRAQVVSTVNRIQKGVKRMQNKKVGIIQSRGLGDIIIALPIARHYYKEGYEVYWPVCEPFYSQMRAVAPWVGWISVPVDAGGDFFYVNPKQQLDALGILEEDQLWLYQYLSSHPHKTNESLFAMMKFDQYKYANVGLPFGLKWTLSECITRNPAVEDRLYNEQVVGGRYMVYQSVASDLEYPIDLEVIDPDVQRIELREIQGYSVFDWLKIIEGAETCILIDSVFANLIDQLKIEGPDLYYIRKWNRRVDGNPVLLGPWTFVDVADPEGVQVRSMADQGIPKNPAVEPAPKAHKTQGTGQGSGETYTPYGSSSNTANAAQRLQASLGLKR